MNAGAHLFFGAVLGLATASFLAAGCAHVDIKDPDPALKIPGIKRAASERDLSQRQELVKDLESDDAAVRFYAISALERLTGTTAGYEYYGDEASRAKAVARWKEWLAGQSIKAGPNGQTEQAAKEKAGI